MRTFYFIIFFLFSPGIFAQPAEDLSRALSTYKSDVSDFLKEIRKTRAKDHLRISRIENALLEQQVFDGVRAFDKKWNTRAVLLLFFYQEGNLKSFIADGKGLLHSGSLSISRDSLLVLELNIRNSIGVYRTSSLDRGVDSRGLGLKPTNTGSDSNYIRSITRLLVGTELVLALGSHDHLLILPALNLYTFPFAALQPFEDNSFLGARVPITILPNLYEFCNDRSPGDPQAFSKGINRATLVGNPQFNRYLKPGDYYGRNKTIEEFFLEELPYTEIQTTAVREMLLEDSTGRVSIDFLQRMDATLTNTLKTALGADLVYIATHGFSSSRNPWDSSFIAFARERDRRTSNLWTSRSICNQSFRARLVVLSACQTGTGQLWNAGILSLANSFYYAGVDHVISTLWNVDDYFTSVYMRQFMKGLITDGSRHPSYYLHLMYRSAKTSPRYWAGFACYGK